MKLLIIVILVGFKTKVIRKGVIRHIYIYIIFYQELVVLVIYAICNLA